MRMIFLILSGLCLSPPSAVHADAKSQKVTRFGPWYVMVDSAKNAPSKNDWVSLGQSQNEDDAGIGDNIYVLWTVGDPEYKISLEIQECDKDAHAFFRSATTQKEKWKMASAKAAAAELQAIVNRWIKEANGQCDAKTTAKIFKMTKLDLAMKEFLGKVAKVSLATEDLK